jgi:dihydroorotate dehydrogenase
VGAQRAWFWGLMLGIAMLVGGTLAFAIASTRVVLPYDESLCGMTRDKIAELNPRLLPFMAHDRVTLAGTMLAIGILYSALAWNGIRRGAHWAQVALSTSAFAGFLSLFLFLGFGYFDPFHAFVTSILFQFLLLCVAAPLGESLPIARPEWRETAAWRRGLWGQLLFVVMGVGLLGAGTAITVIGCTDVFVRDDLAFLRTTAAELLVAHERLVPLVAHDRASLGGMLVANGVLVLLCALWGFRTGAGWLWRALAWAGNVAFLAVVGVHFVVGYKSTNHLAPAFFGWGLWTLALVLTRQWLTGNAAEEVADR